MSYVMLCSFIRSSATYDHKDSSLGVSGVISGVSGGIAVPVVKSMSSSHSWSQSHDSPSSWTSQQSLGTDPYPRYSSHQRLLLNHSATCNPAAGTLYTSLGLLSTILG